MFFPGCVSSSVWATLRSPAIMTGLSGFSALILQIWSRNAVSYLLRYSIRSRSFPTVGTYILMSMNLWKQRVKILPYWLCQRSSISSVAYFGRYFENTATPEYPDECFGKFQYPWYPLIFIGEESKFFWSALVSVMQRMSGLLVWIYGYSIFLLMTERMPLTFQQPIISFEGVVPQPQGHRSIEVFVQRGISFISYYLNIFALFLTAGFSFFKVFCYNCNYSDFSPYLCEHYSAFCILGYFFNDFLAYNFSKHSAGRTLSEEVAISNRSSITSSSSFFFAFTSPKLFSFLCSTLIGLTSLLKISLAVTFFALISPPQLCEYQSILYKQTAHKVDASLLVSTHQSIIIISS